MKDVIGSSALGQWGIGKNIILFMQAYVRGCSKSHVMHRRAKSSPSYNLGVLPEQNNHPHQLLLTGRC